MEINEKIKDLEETVEKKVNGLSNSIEKKIGIPAKEIKEEFEAIVSEFKKILDLDEDLIKKRAYIKLKSNWQSELDSDAPVFEGMIVAALKPYDFSSYPRFVARQEWEKDKDSAIENGFANADGELLDYRKKFNSGKPNPNYGKKLPENNWSRNIYGVCLSPDIGEPEFFHMQLTGNSAVELDIPVFTPVRFRAKPAETQPGNMLRLWPWAHQSFEEIKNASFTIEDVLKHEMVKSKNINISRLEEWAKSNNSYDDFVITEGDVIYLDEDPHPRTGNLRMVLYDDTMEDRGGYTCWIPEDFVEKVDFGTASRLIVSGTTSENEFNGEVDYNVNIAGLYAIPELKTPRAKSRKYSEDYEQIY